MADNIEIKLDQLTQAVKGLIAKSSTPQGEIYNTLQALSTRYENATSISNEKIVSTLVNEFRKSLEIKYSQTNQFIKELEDNLREFATNQASQNPKITAEIARLINETTNFYTKLSSQELILQKILGQIELQKNLDPTEEIVKLSDNFLNFSRGFENITITLNKNFADFLSQIKDQGSKEEVGAIKSEIDVISGNINSIISALSIIDTKYRDLSGLVEVIQNRENIFNDALRQVQSLEGAINSLKENILSVDSKDEIAALNSDIKNQFENVKYEIQKIINTTHDSTIKTEVLNLSDNVLNLNSSLDDTKQKLDSTKQEVINTQQEVLNFKNSLINFQNEINYLKSSVEKANPSELTYAINSLSSKIENVIESINKVDNNSIANNVSSLSNEITNIKNLINDEILYNTHKRDNEFQNYLNSYKEEVKALIEGVQKSVADLNKDDAIKLMQDLSNIIPSISTSLDAFKTEILEEGMSNLSQIKNSFSETVIDIRENLLNAIDKIQQDAKAVNQETLDVLKIDLQKLSDHFIDNVEGIDKKLEEGFSNSKKEFDKFSLNQQNDIARILDKLNSLEVNVEGFSQDSLYKITDSLSENAIKIETNFKDMKGDILGSISNFEKNNQLSLNNFEAKLDKILDSYLGSDNKNLLEKKSLRETVVDIETKVDRTNLQQIHNAKELLEEIQATSAILQTKIANIEETKTPQGLSGLFSRVGDKLSKLESTNSELSAQVKEIKQELNDSLKENIEKISSLLASSNLSSKNEGSNNETIDKAKLDELSTKIQEYLSNIEFLKSNIALDIKENLNEDFSRLEASIKALRTSEDNPNYTYTLEDVESDLAKVCYNIEKNTINPNDFKAAAEKIAEVRNLSVENVKLNRDTQTELGHLNGWCKDAVEKIEDVAHKLDDIQNIGFADLQTRLVQSEKSKHDVAEQNVKIENALKALIKNARAKDEQILKLNKRLEVMAKTQAEAFNPSQFIDIFYENMTQTKMLSNRVEIIEDKINNIQASIERLLSYVEN